ncbi:MAG: ABC transporter permease [Alphaproteobacteria bacterium]|nr:ABC transporter permease [Alphaproteobacteria bacterium]
MASAPAKLPAWIDIGLLPLINVALAFVVSGLLIAALGQDPFEATWIMLRGAFGYEESLGYTFYYTTNFIFTGLAVAVAFHAGLFNIGGEGQAYMGGLGVGIACLALDQHLPFALMLPVSILAAALFGAAWAYIPAYLQAKRGSHIVITTIMFNFIASALMTYLMVEVLIKPGQQSPESREFEPNTWLPFMHEALGWLGMEVAQSPLNLSVLWALVCCLLVWGLIWHTRWGYEIRTVGANATAAVYAGIPPARIIILAMCISGALSGFVGVNELNGVQHRLMLDFAAGYGFTGIAVSLMGRNHPIGIILASLLFGALYQGGAELAFENAAFTPDLIVVIQGLVVLFSGALSYMLRGPAERLYLRLSLPTVVEA